LSGEVRGEGRGRSARRAAWHTEALTQVVAVFWREPVEDAAQRRAAW
jgi:hypothetical protein